MDEPIKGRSSSVVFYLLILSPNSRVLQIPEARQLCAKVNVVPRLNVLIMSKTLSGI